MMGSRKTGWAKYAPLRRYNGGGGRKPTYRGKNAGMDAGVFFYLAASDHGEGAVPPPLSRKRTGLRPERNVVKRREQTPPILLLRGGSPAARGRDNIVPPLYRRLSTLIL
jgi:hypothetical protein